MQRRSTHPSSRSIDDAVSYHHSSIFVFVSPIKCTVFAYYPELVGLHRIKRRRLMRFEISGQHLCRSS
ncbi:hypothetical protein V2J09_006219 [Rumex salicifolius]